MNNGLIGFTGFVGTTLQKQFNFERLYRSNNIHEINDATFNTVVCAGAPAQKWIANLKPEEDLQNINGLIDHLKTVKCEKFILISTVDVFMDPQNVNEMTEVSEDGFHAYGKNRRQLEKFVSNHFKDSLIVRLPGLVGPGLRKNIIYDFLNANNLDKIESRSLFQFYPMVNLWTDINIALKEELKLIHLTSEPISVKEIAKECFNIEFENILSGNPAKYNFQSIFGELYGSESKYQYSKQECLLAIRSYVQSEPKKV